MLTTLLTQFAAGCNNEPKFFGMVPWYHYLDLDPNTCEIRKFEVLSNKGGSDALLIGLAILNDLLILGGLVAIAFVIYGGFLYLTSQGSPDQTQRGQSTLQNAIIGLIVAMLAVALVSFIGNRIG